MARVLLFFIFDDTEQENENKKINILFFQKSRDRGHSPVLNYWIELFRHQPESPDDNRPGRATLHSDTRFSPAVGRAFQGSTCDY
jgi:hypothetical protein